MRTVLIILSVFVMIMAGVGSGQATVFEADVIWDGEVLPVEVFVGNDQTGVLVLFEDQPALRFLAGGETPVLLVIDDMNQTFSTVEDRKAIALAFLFALSRLLGVDEAWLESGPVTFFPSGERMDFPPFGESIRLKINDRVSPIYWNRDIVPSFGTVIGQYITFLQSEGITFPFWEEMSSLPGFPVAVFRNGQAVYRLYGQRDIEEEWENHFTFEEYRQEVWVDFLTPWK